jgi:hypothetical protein
LPLAADVECVIEVADSSLETDRTKKLALYAGAGIPQYVILNLRYGCIELHEEPIATEQRFVHTAVLRAGGRLPLRVGAGQHIAIDADRILP